MHDYQSNSILSSIHLSYPILPQICISLILAVIDSIHHFQWALEEEERGSVFISGWEQRSPHWPPLGLDLGLGNAAAQSVTSLQEAGLIPSQQKDPLLSGREPRHVT